MAKNNNLTDFLTGVAGAIRTKKGTSGLINPQDFESEIASIKTEKPEQAKSVTIAENGTIEVTPDDGKVLSKVTITINVQPSKPTYNLSVGDGSKFVDVSTGEELGYINSFEYDKTYKIYTTSSTYKYVARQDKDGQILSVAQGTSANAPQIWSVSDVGNAFAGLTFAKSTAYGTNSIYYFRVNLP